MRVNCARGVTKWKNAKIKKVYGLVRYSMFMDNVSKGRRLKKCPNQGRHGLLCQEKKVAKGDEKNLCKC
jgi:hypothetical protein